MAILLGFHAFPDSGNVSPDSGIQALYGKTRGSPRVSLGLLEHFLGAPPPIDNSWAELASQGLGRKNDILKTENGLLEHFLGASPPIDILGLNWRPRAWTGKTSFGGY